jgi:outer membrane protein OmpA-like peptidoglycan-associated protein
MTRVTKVRDARGWSIVVETLTDSVRAATTVAHITDTVDERISEARAEVVRAAIEAHEVWG